MNSKQKGAFASFSGLMPSLGLSLLLLAALLLVALGREPDLSDECYVFYEAQAAWGSGPQLGGSDPVHRLFGHVVGVPFLFHPDAGLLDLRLWSLALWLFAYGILSWVLAKGRDRAAVCLLPLPLLLHTLHMPVLTYQSLPGVFLALALACRLRAAQLPPKPAGIWLFLLGALCGILPLTHLPLLAPFLVFFGLLLLLERSWNGRLVMLTGFALTFGPFWLLWSSGFDLLSARRASLAEDGNLVPLLDRSLLGEHASAAQVILSARAQRLLQGAGMILGCLTTGLLIRKPLTRMLIRPRPSKAILAILIIGTSGFLALWFPEVRKERTLCGLFTLALLAGLPTLWFRTKRKADRCSLALFASVAISFGILHSLTGSLNTTTYYPTFYMPLLWIPACLLAFRLFPLRSLILPYLFLLGLNLFIALTHGHRAAGAMEPKGSHSDLFPFQHLRMTAERAAALEKTKDVLERACTPQLLLGLHQQPFVYLIAKREAPFGNAWTQQLHPGILRLIPRHPDAASLLVFSHELRAGGHQRMLDQLDQLFPTGRRTEPLGDGIYVSFPADSGQDPDPVPPVPSRVP